MSKAFPKLNLGLFSSILSINLFNSGLLVVYAACFKRLNTLVYSFHFLKESSEYKSIVFSPSVILPYTILLPFFQFLLYSSPANFPPSETLELLIPSFKIVSP
jgi:hypothetical protein